MSVFNYTTVSGDKRSCACTSKESCDLSCGMYKLITGEKTNYDLVVSKSPEEFAEWFWWMLKYTRGYTDSRDALRDWLISPAKKEET